MKRKWLKKGVILLVAKDFYPVAVMLAFNVVDIISGVVAGLKENGLRSSKLRDGLFKKCGFLLCYSLSYLIDNYGVYVGISIGVNIMPAVLFYVCTTETVSVIENICRISPAFMPEKLLKLFHVNNATKERED